MSVHVSYGEPMLCAERHLQQQPRCQHALYVAALYLQVTRHAASQFFGFQGLRHFSTGMRP